MKRIGILFLCLMLVSCSYSQPKENPARTPEPVKEIEGFRYFESVQNGIKLQYPENWTEFNTGDLDDPALLEKLCDMLGVSMNMLLEALSEDTLVVLYDLDNIKDDMAPSFNVRVSAIEGFTPDMLRDGAAVRELTDFFAQQFSEMFSGQFEGESSFTWLKEPSAGEFGNNVFITYSADISMGEIRQSMYQALTAGTDRIFFFTFSAPLGSFDSGTESLLEMILASVEIE